MSNDNLTKIACFCGLFNWIKACFCDLINWIRKTFLSKRYLEQVFSQLEDEFKIAKIKLGATTDNEELYAIDVCDKLLVKNQEGKSSMEDAKRFQWALVMLYDKDTLNSKIPILIKDYKILTGEEKDEELLTKISDAERSNAEHKNKKVLISVLTAKVTQLTVDRTESWKKKTALSVINLAWLIVFLIILLLLVLFSKNLFFVVFSLGGLGGVVSTQQRIMSADASSERWLRDFSSGIYSYLNIFISPIVGGVGALLVLVFLKSDILNHIIGAGTGGGVLFPTFPGCEIPRPDKNFKVIECFLNIPPQEPKGLALLVLYSFLGGFSERVVPDLLDQLSKKVLQKPE